jgi:predicted Zn-ribbon and HTH transcriptional regulator
VSGTVRQQIHDALVRDGPSTAKDLSRAVGASEKDVAHHLVHLARSLEGRGRRLAVEPSRCLQCDFVFAKRERMTRPSACPRCRGKRLTLPRFSVGD